MTSLDVHLMCAVLIALPLSFVVGRLAVSAGFPVTPLDDRLGHVDGLRALLALFVVFHHFIIWTDIVVVGRSWQAPSVALFNNLGTGAVAIFFMITGLVFYPRIIAGIDRVRWRQIYISRAFRILPLSVLVTVVVAAGSAAIMGGLHDAGPLHLARVAADWISGRSEPPIFGYADSMRMNAGVMWSLGYEWLFYLAILPSASALAFALRGRAPAVVVPLGLLVLSLVIQILLPYRPWPVFLMLFSLGMLVAELRASMVVRRTLAGPVVAAGVITVTLLGMTLCAKPYHPLLAAAYASLLLTVASGNSLFGLLSTRTARAIGDASFSIYMLHGLVLFAVVPNIRLDHGVAPLMWLPLLAGAVVALSLGTYVVFERPMITVGKRVSGWSPKRDRSLAIEAAP